MPFKTMLSNFCVPALVYFVVTSALLGKNAKLFSSPHFTAGDERFLKLLKKLGAVPIKSIAFFVLLQAVFLWFIVFLLGESLGVHPAMRSFLYGACLAIGMLVGTFVYVVSDGLVSSALLAHNISSYPADLRENRQSLKACIIPMAVAILSVVFAFSIAILSLIKSGIDVTSMGQGGLAVSMVIISVFLVIVAILSITLKRNTSTLYHSIIAQLENLSSGKKDLTKRISITSVDELGSIAGMINIFSENIASGMKEISMDQQKLLDSSGQLDDNAHGMNTAIDHISNAIDQAHEKANTQMMSVDQASAAIHQIAQSIDSLNSSITTQSESVSQASSAVEEMVGNIASIGKVTEKMADHFKNVNKAANEGLSIQKESSDQVQRVVEQSETLKAANRIIADISSKTNLLAMNAAIEAAHAGDAGRGFSVVADEIRKLAETASAESKKIGAELKQISTTINGIVKGAESSATAFNTVSVRVNETENLVYDVNNAIKEQHQGAEQILGALKRMNEITIEVKTGSNEMQNGNNTMLNEISLLQNQSKDISSVMENITKEINTINKGAEAVSKLAAGTHTTVERIKDIVNDFEV